MKKSLFAFFLAGCVGVSLAQTSKNRLEKDYKNYPHWIEMMQDPQANFFETQKAFYTYWKGRKIEKGGGYKPFKRWEHFMAQQVDEKGNKPQPYQILNELQNTQNLPINQQMTTTASAWQEVGPVQLPSNGTGQPNGLGRVNALGFHPTDANTFYAGAPAGGLWKTTDGGNTWSSNTDQLATLGVSAIVVDHTTPSTVYFGSGDRDANDAPGLGVYKSTDSGTTWVQMNSGMGNRTVGELVMDPNNNSILIAATSGGIYRTTNGGTSWSQSISGNFKDLKLHPTNSSVMYATTGGNLYKSTDNGVSFSLSMTGIPSGKSRLAVGVSLAEPNTVYVLAAQGSVYGGLFKSTDSGANFTTQSTTPNIMDYSTNGSGTSGQAWYDMCIAVSPTNASEVYVGGVNVFKSTNSGSTWTINAHWVGSGGASAVHADQHILRYSPAGKLYVGNDGGVYHKGTSNENWTDISSGLAISQCYKIGQSQTDVNRVIVGYQDNGTGIYDNGNWRTEIGGDGMESAIDYTNSAYMYGELYYGAIRRSTNNGYSFSSIAGNGVNGITESGAWVTPYVLHETDPNTMFIGYRDIWRSTNVKASSSGSVAWTEISSNLGGSGTFRVLEHNEANGNILYAAKGSSLYKSENVMASTVTWSPVAIPGSGSILSIETSELDENIVYISRGSRIYKSVDKGLLWTDITSNIANSQSKTSLVYAPMAIGRGLYVATDYGVFFKPENETDWINYSTGLPNYAKIKEIELYEDNSGNNNHKIRAASYGRGLWSNDIYQTGETVTVDLTATNICIGDTATITADNANTYFWTAPDGSIVGNSAVLNITPTQTTVYTVNGIMSNGDTTQATTTVNVLNPVVSIAGQTEVCSGSSITLTASVAGSGTYNYLWSNGATTQSINITPTADTTYSVTATSTEGCNGSATHQINIVNNAEYLIVEVKTDNYPSETSWTLTGNSGHVYQAFQQGGYTNANTIHTDTIFCVTDSCLTFSMSDSYGDGICCSYGQGHYKIFQSDGTLLTSGGAFTTNTSSNFCVQPQTTPNFTLTVSDSVVTACNGDSVTFNASGADTYVWTNQGGTQLSTNSSLTVLAQSNMVYTVTGTLNGITQTKDVTLHVEQVTVSVTGDTQACSDESIVLTASGASSYLWSNGDTNATVSLNNSAVNQVWVIGQNNGCYSDTMYTNLDWLSNPVISISGTTEACQGDSITLTATGADSYTWSNGYSGSSITILPDSSMSISVQGFTSGCSSEVVFETITVLTEPQITLNGNTNICSGESTTLTVSGADSYVWSDGSTGNSITISPTSNTTITVQGFSNGCSSNLITETITINPLPQITVSGNTPICSGDTITLVASGADTYVWSDGSTGNTLILTQPPSGNLSVQGFSNGCGSNIVTETIVINNTPQVSISGDTDICSGESTTLTASGADSYVWSNGDTGNSITVSPISNTTITVQGFSNGCSSSVISEDITVNTSTVVSISGDLEICSGESTTLTATGADTYLWSDGSTESSITISPNSTTTISVQGFSAGCGSDMVSETITVNALPVVSISGDNTVCENDSVTLTASGADSYVWSDGSTGNSITLIPTSGEIVTVQGFSNGCASQVVSETITVNSAPIISLSGNTTVCDGESVTLTVTGADAYLWSDGSTSNTITFTPTSNSSVTVQGFTLGCSSNIITEFITVHQPPVVSINGNNPICEGDSLTLTANGADTYIWSDGSTGNSITISPTSNTTISVQGSSNGCNSDVVSESIVVNNTPMVTVTGNTPLCNGESITLVANGANSYVWSNGSTGNSVTLTPDSSMHISVQGFTSGCSSNIVTTSVIVNSLPQVTISGNTTLCSGTTTTLTVSGADTYLWSDGSTGNSVTISPISSTTISVQGFSNGCNSDVVFETITVNAEPIISISGDTEICNGDSTTLTVNGADSYLWSDGSTGNSITLSPTTTSSISVQGFTSGCNSAMITETITVLETPVISISGNTELCTGESTTLTVSGADTYLWSDGSTGNSITVSSNATTNISVQGFTSGCSSNTITEVITVNASPQVSISGNTNICAGDSITLTATGATSYLWSNGSTSSSITIVPTTSNSISVQGFSNGCSSDVVTETITVNPSPVITITGNTAICLGESTTLTASGADTYLWSDGSTGSSITLNPDSNITITVQGFTSGCSSNIISENVIVNTSHVQILGNTNICLGDTVTLTATGGGTYLWSTGETTTNINVIVDSNTTISVTSTNNGCTSTDEVNIEITTPPVVNISGNLEVCSGESTTLTASGADTYLWSTGETTPSITVTVTDTTTISVIGTNNGCTSTTESVEILTNPESSYIVIAIKTDWYGYETSWSLDDDLGNTLASHSNANGAYQSNTWYRDTVYCITVGSCYSFTINDSYGDGICCSYGNGQYSITQEDGTILAQGGEFDYTETTDFCIYDPLTMLDIDVTEEEIDVCKKETFSITASGANSYVWTDENGNIVSQSATLTTFVNQTTTFTVTGTTGALTGSETVTVNVLETNKVKIVIKTDWYGYETSWELVDEDGNIVAFKPPFSYQNNRRYRHVIKCLEDKCYTLKVYDSYGDGMCCNYGYGYFKVIGNNGVVLANGGTFGYQTSAEFCFDGPAAAPLEYADMENVTTEFIAKTTPVESDLSTLDHIVVYPNPTNGDLNISAEDSDFFIDRYEITDLAGRLLMDESFNKPFKNKMVNISSFTAGHYIVKLFTGDHVKVVKIVKE